MITILGILVGFIGMGIGGAVTNWLITRKEKNKARTIERHISCPRCGGAVKVSALFDAAGQADK